MSAAQGLPADQPVFTWGEPAREFQARLDAEARRRLGEKAGAIDWRLLNNLVLDPIEGPLRLARLVDADDFAAHAAGALPWWTDGTEPAWQFTTPAGDVFVGLNTARCYTAADSRWHPYPVALLCHVQGCRPGQAAWRIAAEFGLEVPRVPR